VISPKPVPGAFNAPILVMGCERIPYIVLTTLAVAAGIVGPIEIRSTAIVACIYLPFVALLRRLAGYDPEFFSVWRQSLGLKPYYPASGTIWAKVPRIRLSARWRR